jgi:hypothetical protein
MTQQMDQYGDPLAGGKLYFFVAGTVSTPQNAYQDGVLTIPHPNPITLDATGRVPQLFIADGYIKIRLSDAAGVTQLVADNIQVIGSSSGTGGVISTDATTVAQTGDLKARYDTGTHTGWVRCNGRTIGSLTSGASELASPLTEALFKHIWNAADPFFHPVSGGRGATAQLDWDANKTITLPDWRGRVIAGMDDMGTTRANRLTIAGFLNNAANFLGQDGGSEYQTLTSAQTPLVLHQHYLEGTASGTSAGSGAITGVAAGGAGTVTGSVAGGPGSVAGTASGGSGSVTGTCAGTIGDDSPDHAHPMGLGGTAITGWIGAGTFSGKNVPTTDAGNTGGTPTRHQHAFTGGALSGGSFSGSISGSFAGSISADGSFNGGPGSVSGTCSVSGSASVTLGHWTQEAHLYTNTSHPNVQPTMVATIYIKL